MGRPKGAPKPEVDTLDLHVEMSDGEAVDISVKFPKDRGVVAITALSKIGSSEGLVGLLDAMSYDPSVAERIDAMGLEFDEDEDED